MLDRLNPRERVLLLVGGAFLIVLLGWRFAWQPLQAERAEARDSIIRSLTLIRLAENAGELPVLRAATPADTTPLAQRVTQSAEAAGVELSRLDPEAGGLRVTVASAPYDTVANWIATLEATGSLRPVALDISRLTEPGQVSLRLTLEDAP